MAARSEYDAAEAAALAEPERAMGAYISVHKVTRQQYVNHLAGPAAPVTHTPASQREHDRRAAYVAPALDAKLTAAREKLEDKTIDALAAFFWTELNEGRISAADYQRYTVEIRRGYFPRFRARKWSGPAIYELRGASASPEYRKVLQEVRRLWQAQGRRASVVIATNTDAEFYQQLVPDRNATPIRRK